MTHPLIDECSIPMAAHAAAVLRRRARNAHLHEGPRPVPPVCLPCSYLGRYTAVACPSDPVRAPSGLQWRLLEHGGWRLWCARELVREVRRG